ncbi:MAG: DNA-processing protein DprA [Clostridia bacterium]|nr:DNA-processing protein DprA [Clostridia bacterium]
MNESEAMAVLVSAQHISYGQRERALGDAGSALKLLADPHAHEAALGREGIAALRAALKRADRMLDKLYEANVHLITSADARYPSLLAHTAKPPHVLFCMGKEDLDDPLPVSIVGTRRADSYGLRHTRRIARELAERDACIVSGLALGVDTAAHRGALDANGRTVAVLGGALDKLYPEKNRTLMEQILESGGSIVSEYPPGTAPTRYSFVQRNRIVAGMSHGVLVAQAPHKSGALSTVNFALEEGREVFALPGDVDRFGSQLPNQLIAEGARPAACASDILQAIQGMAQRKPVHAAAPQQIALKPAVPVRALDEQEQRVYDQLLSGDLDFDALSEQTGIAGDALGSVLMMLELDGVIVSLPGPAYRLA